MLEQSTVERLFILYYVEFKFNVTCIINLFNFQFSLNFFLFINHYNLL
jgi:hypothetical protein